VLWERASWRKVVKSFLVSFTLEPRPLDQPFTAFSFLSCSTVSHQPITVPMGNPQENFYKISILAI